MLRVIVQTNAAATRSYYSGSHGEYYTEGQEQAGEWGGTAAKRLGLEGRVLQEAFDALCDNKHPVTNERLTLRTKSVRRVGFDLNFHVPKSVSVVYGLTGEPMILEAFRAAIRETMTDIERDTQTRVRTKGQDGLRTTGNLAYAMFIHTTSRPVSGIPDPHLHAHSFVFNLTLDETEARWKAIELGEVYKNAPFYEAVFHSRLTRRLATLGFGITRTEKGWELDGVPRKVVQMFSRRTEQIELLAEQLGITDPDLKSKLGASSREGKQLRFTLDDLRKIWRLRLAESDRVALDQVVARYVSLGNRVAGSARDSLAFAIAHSFERSSVVPIKRLLATALRHGVGVVELADVYQAIEGQGLIVRDYHGERLVTTQDVLAEETRILNFAKRGRGACRPLCHDVPKLLDWLSPQQQSAIRHVLTSADRVVLIRGVAGSGKTTLIRECVHAIQSVNKPIILLAPSAEASRGVLRKEGFESAETVAKFLLDARLQESVRDGVIWIDEAGLLSLKTLDQVFQVAARLQARIILSGDERQHHAVERGSPLTLLQNQAGLEPATIREIRRQKGRYRAAVALLSEGRTVDGFDVLDHELGWVKESADADRCQAIAADYLAALDEGKTALVVSPTHAEGAVITRAIRRELERCGRLCDQEFEYLRLEVRDMTLAERKEPNHYREGDVIEFHTRAKGFCQGDRFIMVATGRGSIAAKDERGRETIIPLSLADRFQVYTPKTVPFVVGDRIRITKNGKSKEQRRLDNGTIAIVVALTRNSIQLDNGVTLSANFGHVTHGYVVTSHASQGKTVDRVFIAQSALSFSASNREQFYVSVSRGREVATVYTDDKLGLRRAIERSDPNWSATELLHATKPPLHVWQAWLARRLRFLRSLLAEGAKRRGAAREQERLGRISR